jgi:hypothetical protein
MADVDMGLNVYEFNKNIMKQLPPIEDLNCVKETLMKYIEVTPAEQYLMMLCREKNDYTLFNLNNMWVTEQFAEDVLECIANRGLSIVNCEIIDNNVAMELWVKEPGQMEDADLYYIFPADEMVITY